MMRIFFGDETADRGLAKIKWARANGVPVVYLYTNRSEAVKIDDLPSHYRGSKWMSRFYVPRKNALGQPGHAGGNMLIRDCDVALWQLRWGK